ncbi:MAG: hypothetical protein WC683_06015 [bacterium]
MLDIQSGIQAVLESRKRRFPQHVNRISSLDDPCVRRLYYMRAAWDKAASTPTSLQGVFETGNILEPVIERIVLEVGMANTPPWRIVGAQMPTNDRLLRAYNIAGTIDGLLQEQVMMEHTHFPQWDTLGVVDIKTMSPNVYARIEEADDLRRYQWTARYLGQVMLYSLAHNLDTGYLLLVNKQNLWDMKLIAVPVEMEHCERLLQKAQEVNEAIGSQCPPEGCNNVDICPTCAWYSYCVPDLMGKGNLQIVDSEELAVVLDRLDELKGQAAEISELESDRDRLLVKGQDVVCGQWLVTWKQTSNGQWRKKIVKMVK